MGAKPLSKIEEEQMETDAQTPEAEEKEIKNPDKLDLALEEFTNDYSDLTLSEKMSNLRSALMWNALMAMKRIKRYGTKSPISAEEQYKQEECMKQFKLFEKMFESEVKAAKLQGKNVEDMDKNWLQDIKDSQSSLGSIVRTMRDVNHK